MKDNEELLVDYLDGRMSAEEKILFEQRLKQDETLLAALEEYKTIGEDLRAIDRNNTIDDVAQWEKEYLDSHHKESNTRFSLKHLLAIAAMFTILAVAAINFLKTPNYASLFQENYSPYEDMVTQRGNSEDSRMQNAMNLYNRGMYAKAAPLFEGAENSLAPLYQGICYLETESYSQAEIAFKQALSNERTREQAQWYLALTFLRDGQRQQSMREFQEIIDNKGHYKHDKALDILRTLE